MITIGTFSAAVHHYRIYSAKVKADGWLYPFGFYCLRDTEQIVPNGNLAMLGDGNCVEILSCHDEAFCDGSCQLEVDETG